MLTNNQEEKILVLSTDREKWHLRKVLSFVDRERRKEKKAEKRGSLGRNRKTRQLERGKMEGMEDSMTGLDPILFL